MMSGCHLEFGKCDIIAISPEMEKPSLIRGLKVLEVNCLVFHLPVLHIGAVMASSNSILLERHSHVISI